MAEKHTHTLTFTGLVPADEAERAEIHAHPKVKEAKKALLDAYKEAGHPHVMEAKVTKARGPKATAALAPVRAAE